MRSGRLAFVLWAVTSSSVAIGCETQRSYEDGETGGDAGAANDTGAGATPGTGGKGGTGNVAGTGGETQAGGASGKGDSGGEGGTTGAFDASELTLAPTSHDYESVAVDSSSTRVFELENMGDGPTGELTVTLTGSTAFDIDTDSCSGETLAPGESCEVGVTFEPVAAAAVSGELEIGDGDQSVSASLEGSGAWPLQLIVSKSGEALGDGNVTVERDDTAVSCGTSCDVTSTHEEGESVTLTVQPVGKSGYWFTGWAGACSGTARRCTVKMDEARTVTANYAAVNFAFVSSETFSGAIGDGLGVQPYEDHCNRLATAAGINNAAEDAYTAVMADSVSTPAQRLTGARGWIRVDGEPFMDTFSETNVLNALNVAEDGTKAAAGSRTHISLTQAMCTNWTDPEGGYSWGVTSGGPGRWALGTPTGQGACDFELRINCMSKTASVSLALPRPPGSKLIFLSQSALPVGTVTPDAHCEAGKPAGSGAVHALLARVGLSASAFLTAGTTYVRPDNVVVGTGAELSGGTVRSGIWQQGNGTYVSLDGTIPIGLTGAVNLTTAGTNASTANDWTNSSGNAIRGADWADVSRWWISDAGQLVTNAGTHRFYCVEE
jgi:hypothetical protein